MRNLNFSKLQIFDLFILSVLYTVSQNTLPLTVSKFSFIKRITLMNKPCGNKIDEAHILGKLPIPQKEQENECNFGIYHQ